MILCGVIYGELKTVSPKRTTSGHIEWNCSCSCGNITSVREEHLRSGKQLSCGNCNYRTKYPEAYKSWEGMKQRCLNPNAPDYPRYGKRGITIYQPWKQSFINFFRDMGNPPCDAVTGKRYTLNRKDNDGNYEPLNCEWADQFTQMNNCSSNQHPAIRDTRLMKPITRRTS